MSGCPHDPRTVIPFGWGGYACPVCRCPVVAGCEHPPCGWNDDVAAAALCHCLGFSHPQHREVCTEQGYVLMTVSGGVLPAVTMPMCAQCAAWWVLNCTARVRRVRELSA